jgi:23S rRNA (uridine2552-2'-O)-methyltransferase
VARDGARGGRRGSVAGKRGSGVRALTVRVRSKGRTASSVRWLERQLNDPYVAEARRRGYRSRALFKLQEIDDKLRLLRPGLRVLDLGAAPGGWTQLAVERVRAGTPGGGRVLAVDVTPLEPLAGAESLELDILDDDAPARIRAALGGQADLVLSDMAPAATGHGPTDHLRIVALAEAALALAEELLAPGGVFVAKVWQGGAAQGLLARLKQRFAKVRHMKPPASRADSAELYVVATGFRPSAG